MIYQTITATLSFKRLIFVFTIFVILPLLAFYLFQIGELVKASYLTEIQEMEFTDIVEKNRGLQIQAINFLSLGDAEEKIEGFDFVKVAEVKYIAISSEYLVKE